MNSESSDKKPIHIFCITSPSEEPKGGDFDYTNVLSQMLNTAGQGITSEHYIVKNTETEKVNKLDMPLITRTLTTGNYDENSHNNNMRRGIVNRIIENIKEQSENRKPILNLQLRLPQTGTLIFPPDISKFRKNGIDVIVTCHEYLQYEHLGYKNNQKVVDEYLKAANKVIFLINKIKRQLLLLLVKFMLKTYVINQDYPRFRQLFV